MAAEENGSGEELEPIFPRDSAGNLQQETAQSDSSPETKTRRMSGFAAPGYWTEERKQKQRELAQRLNQEGKLGGKQPGAGRPRKNKSVAEVVTEKSAEKAERIASKLLDLALNNRSPSVNLGAIDRINKFEQDLEKNMRDDEKELRKLSGPSLDAALLEVLQEHGIGYDYDLPSGEVEEDE